MTTVSSPRSLGPIVPAAPAATTAATPAPQASSAPPSAIVAPSQTGIAGAADGDSLPSMQPHVASVLAWEKKSNDVVTSLMTVSYGTQSLSGRLRSVGAALLTRFAADGGNFSQSVLQSAPGSQTTVLNTLQRSSLHGDAANRISLDIKTADGINVTVTLGSQDNGLAVQIDSTGKLNDADRGALAQLADAFQSAIDGIVAVPPKINLCSLTRYDMALLSSVDLHAQVQLGGAQPQALDFHADRTQRTVIADGPDGRVQVSVDLIHSASLGNVQQRAAAMNAYLKQFDQAGSRGGASAGVLTTFKDTFEQMSSAPPPQAAGATLPALTATDHGLMTGLADFTASMTDTPTFINPMRPGESDTFSYHAAQTTIIGGHGALDRTISQKQQSHLDASFHQPLAAGTPLALDGSKQSQNYYFKQISDDAGSDAKVDYNMGVLTRASVRQTASQSTRVLTYVAGELTADVTTPVSLTVARDLLGLLQAARRQSGQTPADAVEREQALAAIQRSVLLQADPAKLGAGGGR